MASKGHAVQNHFGYLPGGVLLDAVADLGQLSHDLVIEWNTCSLLFNSGTARYATQLTVDELIDCVNAVFQLDGHKRLGAVSQVKVVGVRPMSRVAANLMIVDGYLGAAVYGFDSHLVLYNCDIAGYKNPFLAELERQLRSSDAELESIVNQVYSSAGYQVFLKFNRVTLALARGTITAGFNVEAYFGEKLSETEVSTDGVAAAQKYPHIWKALNDFQENIEYHRQQCPSLDPVALYAKTIAILRALKLAGATPKAMDAQFIEKQKLTEFAPQWTLYALRSERYASICADAARCFLARGSESDSLTTRLCSLALACHYAQNSGNASVFFEVRKVLYALDGASLSGGLSTILESARHGLHDRTIFASIREASSASDAKSRDAFLQRAERLIGEGEQFATNSGRDEYLAARGAVCRVRRDFEQAISLYSAAVPLAASRDAAVVYASKAVEAFYLKEKVAPERKNEDAILDASVALFGSLIGASANAEIGDHVDLAKKRADQYLRIFDVASDEKHWLGAVTAAERAIQHFEEVGDFDKIALAAFFAGEAWIKAGLHQAEFIRLRSMFPGGGRGLKPPEEFFEKAPPLLRKAIEVSRKSGQTNPALVEKCELAIGTAESCIAMRRAKG